MPCLNHPLADAGLAECWVCGQTFCPECLAEFQGHRMCAPCKKEAVSRLEQGEGRQPGGLPPLDGPVFLSADKAIGFGWRMVTKSPIVILVLFVAQLVASALPQFGNVIRVIGSVQHNRDLEMAGLIVYGVLAILNLPIAAWIMCGTWKYLLKMSRGEPADFGDIFSGGPVLSMLGAMFLFGLGTFLGMLLCIVPGVIFALGCHFYAPLLVDRGGDVVGSLQTSWEVTKGHKGTLFVLMLLSFLVAIAGFCLCFVGIFVAVPIIQFATAYAYLTLTRQRTIETAE